MWLSDLPHLNLLAACYGWINMGPQIDKTMISFKNEDTGSRINIWYHPMTVGVQLGTTRKFNYYRKVTLIELERIFQEGK